MKTATELQKDVLEELDWEPAVSAADVGVTIEDGIVTLTGDVASYEEKIAAENAAKRVGGVRGVANDLRVRLPEVMERTDTDIAKIAANALEWSVHVPSDHITVTVKDGWLTLEGDVDWFFQKEAAGRAVRSLTGVKGVSNLIRVKPRLRAEDLKAKIGDALRRSASLDAEHILVKVEGGGVVLSGAVRSWAEREDAEKAAWAAPGVQNVDNRITIETGVLSGSAF